MLAGFTTYLQGLREQGLVRTDLSLQALAALFSSIFTGFFLAAPLLPDAFKPSDEELTELMAETGHRTLEPRDPVPSSAFQTASHTLTQYLDRSVARAQEQLHVGRHCPVDAPNLSPLCCVGHREKKVIARGMSGASA